MFASSIERSKSFTKYIKEYVKNILKSKNNSQDKYLSDIDYNIINNDLYEVHISPFEKYKHIPFCYNIDFVLTYNNVNDYL